MSLNLKAFLTPPAAVGDRPAAPPPDSAAADPVSTNLRRLRIERAHLRAVSSTPRVEETWRGVFGLLAGNGDPHED
ncbi:MAG: hypothetical protein KGM91_26090 [Burkholderiales bacterium]|nr:hypothetical protein [Burkholderiales bacterium]